ncbi:MAG: hypothetical protein H7Z75_22840 [Ferruginibacter sp.]|nr:hypothetical protein [Cytophagales bacterium]
MKTVNKRTELKKQLRTACLETQQRLADITRAAMLQAQESANEEKGAMEDRFESFREQCQINRDMYAKQLQEILANLLILQKMDASRTSDAVTFGTVAVTDTHTFFISIGIGELKVKGKTYFALSTSSPLFKAISGKKAEETFPFRGKIQRILEVY